MQYTQTIRAITSRIAVLPRRPSFGVSASQVLFLAAVSIVALTLLPIVYLVIRAAGTGADGLADLLSARTLTIVGNSLTLVAAVTLTSAAIGIALAWLIARTDLPGRRVWLILGTLPLVIPSFIGALTYLAAFGPRGLLQQALAPLGVTKLPSIYGFAGAWLSLTLFTYPYVLLPVRAALLMMDASLEESARSLGANRWQVFRRVVLPQLRPALASGMLLTALYTLSDFGAVALMRYDAFTRAIFLQYTSSFDRIRAAVLALVVAGLALLLLVLERRLSQTRRRALNRRNVRAGGASTARPPAIVRLGGRRLPALIFCTALTGIGVFVPVGVLVIWLIAGIQAGIASQTRSLLEITGNTAGISLVAAIAAAGAAIPVAWAGRGEDAKGRWLVNLAYLGHGLPGMVIALALVFFSANSLPGFYQTLPLLTLGYVARFLPVSLGSTRSALTQVNPRCEEAARSLGLPPWRVIIRVSLPIIWVGVVSGAAMVFLNTMKELPATLLLAPTGFRTLATQVWQAHNASYMSQVGLPALILMGVSALSLGFILRHAPQEEL